MKGKNSDSIQNSGDGLKRSNLSRLLLAGARLIKFRQWCLRLALRQEGGECFSATAREIVKHWCGVKIGAYSYGECFRLGAWPAGVSVGRYVSVGPGVLVFLRNHPMDRLSLHPFFYNHQLGLVKSDTIETGRLAIEHDAWLGARAIVTPGCRRIGLGAVVAAGAVVTKDVPDFAVMAGVPAKCLRFRFSSNLQETIRRSRWWERSVDECSDVIEQMLSPLQESAAKHPLLRQAESCSQERHGNYCEVKSA